MRRPKTKIEKLLSFSRYKKRLGADSVAPDINNVDLRQLRTSIIEGEIVSNYESEFISNLPEHISHLRSSFQGQSELLFYHAKLIVMIRREYKTLEHFQAFEKLWNQESEFLLKNLNLRWIVSACDTFIDHSKDEALRALCLSVVMIVNTVNMYESERHYWQTDKLSNADYKEQKLPEGSHHLLLFDGLEGIRPERGDTLRNMSWRMKSLSKKNKLGGDIMLEVFRRLNYQYSVYSRFKPLHTKKRTQWWL